MNHLSIRHSYLYAVVALVAILLASIVYVGLKEKQAGISADIQTSKAGSGCYGYGYGYGYGCPEQAFLSYQVFDYNYAKRVWNAEIQYTVVNVQSGSLKQGKKILVKRISQSGTYKTTFKPDAVLTYYFYSQPLGKGTILAKLVVRAPSKPGSPYGYGY